MDWITNIVYLFNKLFAVSLEFPEIILLFISFFLISGVIGLVKKLNFSWRYYE